MSAHRSGFARVNDSELYYETDGAGPAVVLLHGGLLNLRQWDDQVERFARDYLVIRYDARGHGRSSFPAVPYSHHDDLNGLLRKLGIEQAHLVALSQGTAVAVEFTLTFPGMVRSLVLGAAPLRGYALSAEFSDAMRAIIAAGVGGDTERTRRLLWDFAPLRHAATQSTVRERADRMVLVDYSWAVFREDAPQRRSVDPPPAARLDAIAAPTLVVVGDEEMPTLTEQAEFMAKRIPGARMVVIRDAGHWVNMEQPEEFERVVLDFLRSN